LVADAAVEYGGHPILWCLECGLLMEKFEIHVAELVPEWSKPKLEQEDRKLEKFKIVRQPTNKMPTAVLGKKLKDIAKPDMSHLQKIFFNKK
jgi:hypothetical protein